MAPLRVEVSVMSQVGPAPPLTMSCSVGVGQHPGSLGPAGCGESLPRWLSPPWAYHPGPPLTVGPPPCSRNLTRRTSTHPRQGPSPHSQPRSGSAGWTRVSKAEKRPSGWEKGWGYRGCSWLPQLGKREGGRSQPMCGPLDLRRTVSWQLDPALARTSGAQEVGAPPDPCSAYPTAVTTLPQPQEVHPCSKPHLSLSAQCL